MHDRDSFIFGLPVKKDESVIRFLTYAEYVNNLSDLSMISLNVLHIYYEYKKMFKGTEIEEQLEDLKKHSLFKIVLDTDSFRNSYYKIFNMVIDVDGDESKKRDLLERIFDEEELFMGYRNLIMDMNVLSESEVSPNPEIQRAIERSKRVKQKKADKQTFADIVSSIVAGTSNSFLEVANMNVFQVYSIYYRMGAILNYKTSALFATVSEKISIDSWNKHIDLFEKNSDTINRDDLGKTVGGMF